MMNYPAASGLAAGIQYAKSKKQTFWAFGLVVGEIGADRRLKLCVCCGQKDIPGFVRAMQNVVIESGVLRHDGVPDVARFNDAGEIEQPTQADMFVWQERFENMSRQTGA